ncbi:MAG: hypothetical protein GY928_03000, partial [Colwellia sp.]|nr:hypothetical protein [Colwellia sp.]
MTTNKKRLLALVALTIVSLCTSCSYYSFEYRSEELIAENDNFKLHVGYPQIINKECRIKFVWIDSGQQPEARPPYFLSLSIDNITDELLQIDIEDIQIISSLNKKYKFTRPSEFPVTVFKDTEIIFDRCLYYWLKPELDFDNSVILIDAKYDLTEYYSFRPAFDFDYKNKETITLIIDLKIKTSKSTRSKI